MTSLPTTYQFDLGSLTQCKNKYNWVYIGFDCGHHWFVRENHPDSMFHAHAFETIKRKFPKISYTIRITSI